MLNKIEVHFFLTLICLRHFITQMDFKVVQKGCRMQDFQIHCTLEILLCFFWSCFFFFCNYIVYILNNKYLHNFFLTNDLEISSGWSHFGIAEQGHLQTRRGYYLYSKTGLINFFFLCVSKIFCLFFYFVFINIRIYWKPLIQSISLVNSMPFFFLLFLFCFVFLALSFN